MKNLLFMLGLLFLPCAAQKRVCVEKLAPAVDSIAGYGIRMGAFPGCQVVVAQHGRVVLSKCYGYHSDRVHRKVQPTDLYDLASVTKTTATVLAVMKLYDEGRLRLDDRASRYLPFLRTADKSGITISDLLFHQSGFPMTIPFYEAAVDSSSFAPPLTQKQPDERHPNQLEEHLFMSRFSYLPGTFSPVEDATHHQHVYDGMWFADRYADTLRARVARVKLGPRRYSYSDIGFIVLQWVVEAITGQSLSDYVEQSFYLPMGARHTLFLPRRRYGRQQIVPTVQNDVLRGLREMQGYTQDEVASFMGGVAGEAGLFSTAQDLALIYQMYLNKGELNGRRYLSQSTCRLFETTQSDISRRGLGFDRPDAHDAANFLPLSTFGHSGFTGTEVWVDPDNQLVYVFLTNRVSPVPWNWKYNRLDIFGRFKRALYDSLE